LFGSYLAEPKTLDLAPGIPPVIGPAKRPPGLAAMIGFSIAGRPGQDFGCRHVRTEIATEIAENVIEELRRQNYRVDAVAAERPTKDINGKLEPCEANPS
jgi:hypothetical protein